RQQLHNSRDFQQGLRDFPRHLRYERLMLTHLAKQPRDYVGAFRTLPLKLRRIFVQAYQSVLFNRLLSRRVKQGFSLKHAQVGDYVVELDKSGLPTEVSLQVTANSATHIRRKLAENKMCVALPLLGFKQSLSEGAQGEAEQEVTEAEGVNQRDFYITAMPEISAPGRLRAALSPMMDLSIGRVTKDSRASDKQEVQLGFTLYRGSYATVLLREFMKPRNLIESGF
ncbi:MAG: tRNA pseudouridine(13) synthase TruD, partial [Candidatus Bathyarchaeota archaeon]